MREVGIYDAPGEQGMGGGVQFKNLDEKQIGIALEDDMTTAAADQSAGVAEVFKYLKMGEEKRKYGETKLNRESSRSHTVFRIKIESRQRV